MKKIIITLFVIYLSSIHLLAQDKITINGYITDHSNGESLLGATVFVEEIGTGTITNEYGFYSLSLQSGTYTFQYSYLGYETVVKVITLEENNKVDIELPTSASVLEEVVVTSEAPNANVSENQMSVNKMEMTTIQKLPSFLGEVEVLRSIQLLPGVSSVGEGSSGFNVRGGSIDQNLVLLDEAPVYNSSHLFGFFSVFNPDAVKDVKLYKGGIPPRYGGRLSSILDVRMKDGNNKKLSVNGGIGLIFSRLAIEAPIVKDKASFIVAGRRSYIDILARPLLEDDIDDSVLNFYDLTMKANFDLGEKNKIFLSGYFGRDNFGFGDDAGFNWGNSTFTLRWNHVYSSNLFSNVTAYFSDYDYQLDFGNDSTNKFDWSAAIKNYSLMANFSLFISPKNVLRFGGQGIAYEFEPANAMAISDGESQDFSIPKKYAIESALFVENELDITNRTSVTYGLRLSHFNYTGEGIAYTYGDAPAGVRRPVIGQEEFDQWESIKTFLNLEPRVALKYQINENQSIKATYNRTTQYIHLISNTTASTPVDIWTPSTNNISPQKADQIALGYFHNLKNNEYELSAEIYYKKMNHLVDYIDGADLLINPTLAGDLLEGKGRAYGLEVLVKKSKNKLTGWLSYTLARTERQVNGINNNEWYPARYDQTHNLSITGLYDISKRVTVSAIFSMISGTPSTLPTTRFIQQGLVIPHNYNNVRNNIRIPLYHRLDFSLTWKNKNYENRKWKGEWVFSIYNVYNRKNPFSIYTRQAGNQTTEAVRLSVFGSIIPSVAYNFKF